MYPFIRVATDMYPTADIDTINLNAVIEDNGPHPGIEVKLKGIVEGFTYWGPYADLARTALVPAVVLSITPDANGTILIRDIEWVNLNATIGTVQGVEIRVATDAPGITRQFVGVAAGVAYDQLTQLAPTEEIVEATA